MKSRPQGDTASRLRQRKRELSEILRIPHEALPGSLVMSRTRCGKPTCHCAEGEGHPAWSLTFMIDGKKRVERIPMDWVEKVQQRVERARAFKDALAELWGANVELLILERRQRRK
jgi:hypothetical protein